MAACRMMEFTYEHQAVLLEEVLANLAIQPEGLYVDATFGRGGHAQGVLEQLGPKGRLLAMDKDPEAVAYGRQHFSADPRFTIQHGSFAELESFLISQQVLGKVNGILFDLGVSSPQLDDAKRGFSFMRSGKLDMRMDYSQGMDAATWLASIDEQALAKTLWEYGEERFSRRIAKAIVTERRIKPIITTKQLATIVSEAIPVWEKGKHPATRSFQAIRIAINHELDELHEGLAQSLNALRGGGRLLVISFHSLEDRIVKQFMLQQERTDNFPAKLPIKHTAIQSKFKRLGRVKPSLGERSRNPRAGSAILRIGEKLS
ncbi:MAG: rsmH [Gammaproteobacteria bacterium]|nr:rsmH [Gammaproteobacteria bacterium]